MPVITSIEDLRKLAQKRIPKMFYDYVDATMIGQAHLYGLGVLGEKGVTKALEILTDELSRTLGFCGLTDIRQVDKYMSYII